MVSLLSDSKVYKIHKHQHFCIKRKTNKGEQPMAAYYNHYCYMMEVELSAEALSKAELMNYTSVIKSNCNKITEPAAYKNNDPNHKIYKINGSNNCNGTIELKILETIACIHSDFGKFTADITFVISDCDDADIRANIVAIPVSKNKSIVMLNYFLQSQGGLGEQAESREQAETREHMED